GNLDNNCTRSTPSGSPCLPYPCIHRTISPPILKHSSRRATPLRKARALPPRQARGRQQFSHPSQRFPFRSSSHMKKGTVPLRIVGQSPFSWDNPSPWLRPTTRSPCLLHRREWRAGVTHHELR